jgi:hypothetical protein
MGKQGITFRRLIAQDLTTLRCEFSENLGEKNKI